MGFAENYFNKNQNIVSHIEGLPKGPLRFVTVIPAYLEDAIFQTLQSIENADQPGGDIEIIVVANFSESDSAENKKINRNIYAGLTEWCTNHSTEGRSYYPLQAFNLPKKHAGVGLARKIGMDEALWRYNLLNYPEGLILSLDADTLIDTNYFSAIEKSISENEKYGGCILYFEHPLKGTDYSQEVFEAILKYELHLRYYKHIMKHIGFPHVNYTIGSCFGVKAGFYAQQGGMNRRQAGEDFYFLNKLFPHREFAVVTETCVHPSSRPSSRVPFGTGAAVTKIIAQKDLDYKTYSPDAFFDLKQFLSSLDLIYGCNKNEIKVEFEKWPQPVKEFLDCNHFLEKFSEIKSNSSSPESFVKRFYHWFDGFRVVKYLNYTHGKYYHKMQVEQAVAWFFERVGYKAGETSLIKTLEIFRKHDRQKIFIS